MNVTEAVKIGSQQMTEFHKSLPEGFHERLSLKVITISARNKRKKNWNYKNLPHRPDLFTCRMFAKHEFAWFFFSL